MKFVVLSSMMLTGAMQFLAVHQLNQLPKPKVETVSASSFKLEEQADCKCPIGKFWSENTKECLEQKGFGYECGFFPKNIWHRVCADGYKCTRPVNTHDSYHGSAAPATCRPCPECDHSKRHENDCVKLVQVSGEACAEVKITVHEQESATKTAEATKTVKATEKATETATESATATTNVDVQAGATAEATKDGVTVTADGDATVPVEVKAKGKETAEATSKASAEGTATVKTDATVTVQAKAEATVKRCISLEDAVDHVAPDELRTRTAFRQSLAEEIKAFGDNESFEQAYNEAIAEAAEKAGEKAEDLASEAAKETAKKTSRRDG